MIRFRPWSGGDARGSSSRKMSDELVQQLKATVDGLEKRVKELEGRLRGDGERSGGGGGDSMRMILIGPPGAGE